MPITQIPRLLNNVKKRQKIARNSKYPIIVLPKNNRILNNRYSIMDLSSQSSPSIEIFLSTNPVCIKSTPATRNSAQATPLK